MRRNLPVAAEIIPACDSEALSDKIINEVYRHRIYKPFYPFRLTKSEIACFLSHRQAWLSIVRQGLDAGFIIEDDIALTPDFSNAFSFSCQYLDQMAFIRFPFRKNESGSVVACNDQVQIIRPVPVGLGQVAQLISHDAAQQLLEITRYFDRPVDTMMQLFPITGVRPFSVIPGGVMEISQKLGGSTLEKQCKFTEKLYREIMRPVYRSRIALLSRQKD